MMFVAFNAFFLLLFLLLREVVMHGEVPERAKTKKGKVSSFGYHFFKDVLHQTRLPLHGRDCGGQKSGENRGARHDSRIKRQGRGRTPHQR
ncbi:hypothetical protein BJ741DRAFT_67186 [Chytriomyces cf. hyalinus JEL632]|nr:hypothetical protein BJ741DRAFT_67186 [Chytriomyces cf. hyalinus JEL632]